MSRMYSIIEKSKQNLEAMRDLGLITEKQYNHYKEDLLAGKDQIDKKKGSEIFTQILYKWDAFMESSHEVLENYKKMSDEDQKKWKEKINAVLFFSIGHFVTFLESDNKNVYQKVNSILDHMNSLPQGADHLVFMFELEKQAMRFFSLKEFKRCKF